jgi:hypothetical protein
MTILESIVYHLFLAQLNLAHFAVKLLNDGLQFATCDHPYQIRHPELHSHHLVSIKCYVDGVRGFAHPAAGAK